MPKPLTNPNGPYPIYDSSDGLPPKGTAHYFEALPPLSRPAVDPFKNEPIPPKSPKSPKSHKKKKGGRSRKSKRRR